MPESTSDYVVYALVAGRTFFNRGMYHREKTVRPGEVFSQDGMVIRWFRHWNGS